MDDAAKLALSAEFNTINMLLAELYHRLFQANGASADEIRAVGDGLHDRATAGPPIATGFPTTVHDARQMQELVASRLDEFVSMLVERSS